MSAILAIMFDWFLRIRSQAAFKIMLILVVMLVAVLALIEFGDDEITFAWTFSGSLDGMFRSLDLPELGISPGRLLFASAVGLYSNLIPGVGFLVALFATAGVVPDLMRRGRIDLLLARPVTRTQVVLGNFAGGLLFVVSLSTLLVGGSWIAFAARGQVLDPLYLANLPLIVGQYAIVYAVALLLGFLIRSFAAVLLLTMAAWGLGWIMAALHGVLEKAREAADPTGFQSLLAGPLGWVIELLYWISPRPGAFDRVSDLIMKRLVEDELSRALGIIARSEGEDAMFEFHDWIPQTVGSLGLIVGCLGLSVWVLRRRDF